MEDADYNLIHLKGGRLVPSVAEGDSFQVKELAQTVIVTERLNWIQTQYKLESLSMPRGKEFSLSGHIRKISRNHNRETIPEDLYDVALPMIISALHEAISSPENDTGVSRLVIFGSWARRNNRTGPTANSDLDLLAYTPTYLSYDEYHKLTNVVLQYIALSGLESVGIHLRGISVFSEIDDIDLVNMINGSDEFTKHGYIIVD